MPKCSVLSTEYLEQKDAIHAMPRVPDFEPLTLEKFDCMCRYAGTSNDLLNFLQIKRHVFAETWTRFYEEAKEAVS